MTSTSLTAQPLSTSIRPGVTDVTKIGGHVATTDHTRQLEDGRHVGYAIGYSAPIGPIKPVSIDHDWTQTSLDFRSAADLLRVIEAPAAVIADVADEADWIADNDPQTIGSPEVAARYLQTSRVCRRQKVTSWMDRSGMGNPGVNLRQALDMIGGVTY